MRLRTKRADGEAVCGEGGLDAGDRRTMNGIVIYEKRTCTTCRKVHAALVESGVDFEAVNYYVGRS